LLFELEHRHPGGRVLLFAHEMTAYLLRYLLEGVAEKELLAVAHNTVVANGSVTSWSNGGSGFLLEHEHVTEHLREQGVQPTESEDGEVEAV
jgi:broad specificity phosphatase PhoE